MRPLPEHVSDDETGTLSEADAPLGPSALRYAPQSTPRRAHKPLIMLGSPSSGISDDEEYGARPQRVRLSRGPLPPARQPASAREAVSTSSSTLVDAVETHKSSKADLKPLTHAMALAQSALAANEGPDLAPRRSRLSLTPPPPIDSRSFGAPSSQAHLQASARVREMFDRAKHETPLPAPMAGPSGGREMLPEEDLQSSMRDDGLQEEDPIRQPTMTPRDRARFQRKLGLSIGDRDRPALQPAGQTPVSKGKRRDFTAFRAPAAAASEGDADDDSEGPAMFISPTRTPHPPGHLTFSEDSPSSASFARTAFRGSPRAPGDVRPAASGSGSLDDLARTSPVTSPPRVIPSRRDTPSTPPRIGASPQQRSPGSLYRRLQRIGAAALEAHAAAPEYHMPSLETPTKLRQYRKDYREGRMLLDDGFTPAAEVKILVTPLAWWQQPAVMLPAIAIALCLLTLLMREHYERVYRQAYFDGLVPSSVYPPLDWAGPRPTAETMRVFGPGATNLPWWSAVPHTARQTLAASLLRWIQMPPRYYRTPA